MAKQYHRPGPPMTLGNMRSPEAGGAQRLLRPPGTVQCDVIRPPLSRGPPDHLAEPKAHIFPEQRRVDITLRQFPELVAQGPHIGAVGVGHEHHPSMPQQQPFFHAHLKYCWRLQKAVFCEAR
jgi:hypothetical protein